MNEEMQIKRTPEVVAAEIRGYTASMLTSIIEIGRRLKEAKAMLPHGEFMAWVETNTGYKQSTANNFMRLFEEFGERQGSLFGAELSNSQTFGNLTYSKALALLSVPESERNAFVEEHDVEAMTTAELRQAIRERDEARKALQTTEARLADTQKTLAGSGDENRELLKKLAQAREDLKAADNEAEENERRLKERIKALESRPVDVAVQVDEEAVKRAAEEARTAANEEWKEKLRKAENKLAKAEKKAASAEAAAKSAKDAAGKEAEATLAAAKKEAADAKAEAESLRAVAAMLRRELAMSDAAVTAFKVHFAAWQQAHKAMTEDLAAVSAEAGDKLRAAIAAQLDAWKGGAA